MPPNLDTVGLPTVAPRAAPPDDYIHLQTSPNMFGGAIASGEQALGQGATKAGQFYGQVAADDATNNYMDFANKLLHGDPNKTVQEPGGEQMPDTGYLGLKGEAALRARQGVAEKLDEQIKTTAQGVP